MLHGPPRRRSAAAAPHHHGGARPFLLAALVPTPDCVAFDDRETAVHAVCERKPALRPLLAGEIRRGHEIPAALASMLRQAGSTPWLLGLGIPYAEQARIDTFLRTEGTPQTRAALAGSGFWASELRHGSGDGLLRLIDAVRALRRRSPRFHVVCVGTPDVAACDSERFGKWQSAENSLRMNDQRSRDCRTARDDAGREHGVLSSRCAVAASRGLFTEPGETRLADRFSACCNAACTGASCRSGG